MMKKIISLSLFCVLGLGITGCASSNSDKLNKDRFVEAKYVETLKGMEIFEYIDKETGVHYYIGTSRYKGVMSPVYNSDGTVRVDK